MEDVEDYDNMSWIDDELMEEEFYDAFYNSPIESIQIVQILFDDKCEKCYNISRSSYQLNKPGCLSAEELIPILRCQTTLGFTPLSILKFAIEVDSTKIAEFISDEDDIHKDKYINNYQHLLTEVSYTNDVTFKDSTKALEPTATLFILYRKKSTKRTRNTRVNRNNNNSANSANQTTTKRKMNKTRRRDVSFE